jgi:hypothetical protein
MKIVHLGRTKVSVDSIPERFSISKLAVQVRPKPFFQTAVVTVQHRSQGTLGGLSLTDALQDADKIGHSVVAIQVAHGCERLIVG